MDKTPGRPKTDNPRKPFRVYLTDEERKFCLSQPGGGSEYISRLIAIDKATQEARALLADEKARDLVAAILQGYYDERLRSESHQE